MAEWTHLFVGRKRELKQLQDAWALARAGTPQVVAVVAESGYGKTRLAQEFFTWLSTEQDGVGGAGYWPDRLVRIANNLVVNPDPADCASADTMPYLWWGLRLADPGARNETVSSALTASEEHLRAHLAAYTRRAQIAERRRQQAMGGGLNITDIGLNVAGMAPGLGTIFGLIGLGKTLIQGSAEAVRLEGEIRALQRPVDHAGQAEQRRLDLVDLVVNDLRTVAYVPPAGLAPVPLVLLIDDAQWSRQDQTLCAFISKLLEIAGRESWPLLVVVTCWEQEWRRGDDKGVGALFHAAGVGTTTLVLSNASDLDTVVRVAFPGLSDPQVALIVERADGNPRFLDEVLHQLKQSPKLFVDRDPAQSLTTQGETLIEAQKFEDVVLDRLRACPDHVQGALSIASLQGIRFSSLIVRATAGRLNLDNIDGGLAEADAPYAFVRTEADAAGEFRARTYQRVARENLANLVDEAQAESVLRDVLASFTIPDGASATEEEEAWEAQLVLLESHAPVQRTQGLAALAMLVEAARRRFDLRTERKLVLRWAKEWQRGWGTTAPISHLITVIDSLLRNDEVSDAAKIASTAVSAMDDVVAADPSLPNLRDQVKALERAGEASMRSTGSDAALGHFRKGLSAAEVILAADPSPASLTMVSIMHWKIGHSLEELEGPAAALPFFQDSLRFADQVATGDIDNDRARAATQARLGKILRRLGKSEEALSILSSSLAYWDDIFSKKPDPVSQRETSIVLTNIANTQCDVGLLEEALLTAERSLLLSNAIAASSCTIQAKNDALTSVNILARVQQAALGSARALPRFREAVTRAEEICSISDGLEYLCNLSVSLNNLGGAYRQMERPAESITFYERSVRICSVSKMSSEAQGRMAFEAALIKLGAAYLEAGRPSDAVSAIRRIPRLAGEVPGSLGSDRERQQLLEIVDMLAKAIRATGDLAGAAESLEQAASIRGEIAVQQPTVYNRYEHSVALVHHGDAIVAVGRPADALYVFEQAGAINQDLLSEDTAPVWRHQAVITQRIGDLKRTDQPADQVDWYKQSLAAFERVAALAPATAVQFEVALALEKLALALLQADRKTAAMANYRRLAAIRGQLAADGNAEMFVQQIMALVNAFQIEEDGAAEAAIIMEIVAVAQSLVEVRPNARSFFNLANWQWLLAHMQIARWRPFSAGARYLAFLRARAQARAKLKAHGWSRQQSDTAFYAMRNQVITSLPDDEPIAAIAELAPSAVSAPSAELVVGSVETRPIDEWLNEAAAIPEEPVEPVSRNAPCPCGSGERFKNCHGRLS